jgi:manganese/zinc/iron transport system permease protein
VYFFAPKKGVLSVMYRQKQQRKEVSLLTFLLHLNNHQETKERHINHLREHINWQQVKANTVVKLALDNNMITITDNVVTLTQKGLSFTQTALAYIITNKDDKIEHLKDDFFLFRG